MLENHVTTVTYVLSSVILTISGDIFTEKVAIPVIKGIITGSPKIVSILLGTVLVITLCYLGVLFVCKFLLSTDFVNSGNVDIISIIGFLVLAAFLNVKYSFG